jgi:hypothetical protein
MQHLKWTMNWTGKAWTFQSVATGLYLSIDSTPANGTHGVAASTPFE